MISRWLGVGMGWLWVWLVSPTAFGLKPLSDPTRPHAVLQCFDRFNIPTFKSDDCDPVIGDATVLIQLGVSGGSPPFAPIVGWRLKGGLADDPVRLAGVLEVRFSRSLSPSRIDETTREEVGRLRRAGCVTGEIHPAVPVAAGSWQIMESWLNGGKGTPEERARTACDLLIFARGYEAGGEPDMAKQLAEWALALMPEPDLHREAPRRLGEWMYQVAFDRWANGCGWERFADDLTDLGKKAPEGWPMLAGVRELAGAAQKAASALTEPEPGSLAGQLRRALLAPSSNSQVQKTLAEHFSKHPDAKQLFLIGSRRGTKSNTWIVDPSAPEWPKLINHLGTWFFDSSDRTLSQTSILLIGARRTLFDP